jgi:subtilisin-like proprotein convertase family protein
VKGPRIVVSRIVSLVIAAGLLAGLSVGVLATAQSPPPDNRRHLLLVPSDAEGTAALARTDARVLARYESFSLVEAQGGDDERLRSAGAERRDDMRTVETAAGEVDPRADRASLAAKEGPDRQETLALVQFVGPPKDAWLERLRETGARIVTYQAENAYVVHARGAAVDRLAALQGGYPAVRAVSVLTAADKLEERASPSGVFAVTTMTGTPGEGARDEAAALAGPAAAAPVTVGALRTEYRNLSSAEVAELARDPGVVAVEAYAEPELFDERAAQIVAGRLIAPALTQPTASDYVPWLVPARIPSNATFDFAIDVTDEGFDNGTTSGHNDFRRWGNSSEPSRVAYLRNYTTDSNARDCSGHGTNVASIAAGYNNHSNQPAEADGIFNHGMGVAPFARVGASKIFACNGAFSSSWTPAGLTADAYAGLARISNNSWGRGNNAAWGDYSANSAAYDQLVRDAHPAPGHQPMVEVFAGGNHGDDNGGDFKEGYGTISTEGSAKNVITVGAAEGVRPGVTDLCGTPQSSADSARDIVNFSSRGPTDDGRLKPDLVAPGTHITGAAPLHSGYNGLGTCGAFPPGSSLYSIISGSSQATPQVSGAAALVRRWYKHTKGVDPSPALTKALLVNTATDMAGGNNGKGDSIAPGPNTDQGWGRVNVGNALDSTVRQYRDQDPDDVMNESGESRLHTYSVQNAGSRVRVTLAWTDAPGPTTGNPVLNDLDLVVDAGGRTYKGNVFAGALSRTGGSADPRNNVESVYLPAGTSGRFAVKVVGTNIPGDGVPGNADTTDQDFALVVSNAVEVSAPVLVQESTTIDDSGPGGDGDGVIESDEQFELSEEIRNAGKGSANELTATLTADGGLDVTVGSSDYPDLAEGATGFNLIPFVADLPNAAACGVDVPAELEIDSASPVESYAIPLVLPTGELGAPFVADSGDIPKSIPDDSAAGVTSSVFVSDAGRIKDVDVTIGALRHGWLGDLVIDIIAPDGTTVRLVEHPGGPDNGAKDMVAVTFDDDASGTIPAGPGPVTGSFKPQNDQLSRLDGKQRQGTWTLRVRDLFEGDTGTLEAWGATSRRAVCDIDTEAPDTMLGSAPGDPSNSTAASFSISSNDSGATFECRLDGGAWLSCDAPKTYSGLADGDHGFSVRAVDGSGNRDPDPPPTHTWTIDATPPETAIASGPPAFTRSGDSTFILSASEQGVTFRCQVDGGAPESCSSTQRYTGIGEGQHTLRAAAVDALGNVDSSPAVHTWTVDRTAPVPSVSAPAGPTTDRTPTLRGGAGVAPGDAGTVTVSLFSGTLAAGLPTQTLIVPLDTASGAWAVEPATLTEGTWTVRVEQADAAGNVGTSAAATFTVLVPPPPPPPPVAPSFLLAPAEERLSDALAGRLRVVAACASACQLSARLTVSPRASRRLGLGAKSTALGKGSKRLSTAGTVSTAVRLNTRARAALRRRATMTATLRVTLAAGGQELALSRTISLRRSAGLRRVVSRGLRLWAVCSERCPLSGKLTLSAKHARRIGLKPRGSKRMRVAAGRTTAQAGKPARLTLKVRRGAKKAMKKARRVRAVLETVAGNAPNPRRTVNRSLTLRR